MLIISDPLAQMDRKNGLDYFSELPVSLVLFALITVDVVERIRPFKLLGQCESLWVVSLTDCKSGCRNVRHKWDTCLRWMKTWMEELTNGDSLPGLIKMKH